MFENLKKEARKELNPINEKLDQIIKQNEEILKKFKGKYTENELIELRQKVLKKLKDNLIEGKYFGQKYTEKQTDEIIHKPSWVILNKVIEITAEIKQLR